MKNALFLATLLVLSPVLLSQTSATSAIEGTVVDAAQSQPLAHAQVILTKNGGTLGDTLSGITDDSGKFTVRNIPPANWRLFVEHERYLRTEYGQRAPGKVGVSIAIAPGQNLKLVVSMTAAGVAHGRVVNEYGEPVRNAVVKALTPRYTDGLRSLASVKAATTNDLGEFRLFGLIPGRYYLSAEKARATIPGTATAIPPSVFSSGVDVVSYYPNASNERAAAPFDVGSGVTADVGNLVIRHTAGVHVRGRIIIGATNGQTPADILVEVWHLGGQIKMDEVAIQAVSVSIGPGTNEGKFDFTEFAPGAYTIEASAGRGIENVISGTIDVEVGDVDVNDLSIVAAPRLKNVRGRITVDGRGPVDNDPDVARIGFILGGAGFSIRVGAGFSRVQPNGEFALTNVVPGFYPSSRITLMGLPAGWFIKSARLGDTDILKDGLGLTTPPQAPMEIVISPNGAIVDAVVFDDVRKPIQGVRVVLLPDEPRRRRYELYQDIMSDASGRTHFVGIPPGNYKLFAWDDVLPNQWQDTEFLRTQESRGVAIVLREGEHREVELKAIAGGQ